MNEYNPLCPPPEPPLGTVVKDRHGALSMRQRYGALEGWGDPWGGVLPLGGWNFMWEARGPLEVVPHPRTVKEERVTNTPPKIFAVVDSDVHSDDTRVIAAFTDSERVIAVFSDEDVAKRFAKHPSIIKSYGKVCVKPLDVLPDEPTQVILYRKRSGGTVVVEKFWDFEVEERISQGWFRTVEEAFEADA